MKISNNTVRSQFCENTVKKLKFLTVSAHFFILFLIVFTMLKAGEVQAAGDQKTPDAGQILNEIERDIEVRPIPQLPKIEDAAPAAQDDQGPKVFIKQFKFQGNKAISEEELQAALTSLTNREISITQLKTSTDLIATYYREKGFLGTATLPDQDITEGVVVIQITEAIFGDVKFDGQYNKDFKRVRPGVIESAIGAGAMKGKPLDQAKLDAALAKVDRLAGIKIQSTMQAGEAEGTTDLLVKVKDLPLLNTYVALDNTGGRQTGRIKSLAYLTLSSPFGFGETVNLTALHSEGTDYGKLGFMVPVGISGLEIGAGASYLEYDVIANESKNLGLRGLSSVFSLNSQYSLIKNKLGKLTLAGNIEQKNFLNKSNAEGKTSDYDLKVYSLVLSGDRADGILAGGVNNLSLDLGMGEVNLNHSNNETTDQGGAHTHGSYTRLRWNLSRNQFLTDSLALTLSGSGQFANANLDSSEKFYLGGINGVRAYPTSEGGGSEGYLYTAELRKYLPNNLSVAGFIDHGFVRQFYDNKQADGEGTNSQGQPNAYSLKGYGASLNWQGPRNTNFKVTYARRMGNNPNPATNGYHDQDGSKHVDVFWLSGSVNF